MKSYLERLEKFARLSAAERAFLIRAWLRLLLIDLELRLFSFNRILERYQSRSPAVRTPYSRSDPIQVSRAAWLVEVAGRYSHVRTYCLEQALALHRLLKRIGIGTSLQIGVRRGEDVLRAHAWLEREGEIIYGPPDEELYEPLQIDE